MSKVKVRQTIITEYHILASLLDVNIASITLDNGLNFGLIFDLGKLFHRFSYISAPLNVNILNRRCSI